MKDYTKLKKCIALISILFLLFPNIMPMTNVYATSYAHYDFNELSDINDLQNQYVVKYFGVGTLLWTDSTTITGEINGTEVKENEGIKQGKDIPDYYYEVQNVGVTYDNNTGHRYDSDGNDIWANGGKHRDLGNFTEGTDTSDKKVYVYGLKANQNLGLHITNCAYDNDRNMCDVDIAIETSTQDNGKYSDSSYSSGTNTFNNWLGRDFLHSQYGYDRSGTNFHRADFYSQYFAEHPKASNTNNGEGGNTYCQVPYEDIPRTLVAVTNDNGFISFTIMTNKATGKVRFHYYKHDTYETANITNFLTVVNDIDVVATASKDAAEMNDQTWEPDGKRAGFYGYAGTNTSTAANENITVYKDDFKDINMYCSKSAKYTHITVNGDQGSNSSNHIIGYKNGNESNSAGGMTTNADNSIILTETLNNTSEEPYFKYSMYGSGIGFRVLSNTWKYTYSVHETIDEGGDVILPESHENKGKDYSWSKVCNTGDVIDDKAEWCIKDGYKLKSVTLDGEDVKDQVITYKLDRSRTEQVQVHIYHFKQEWSCMSTMKL